MKVRGTINLILLFSFIIQSTSQVYGQVEALQETLKHTTQDTQRVSVYYQLAKQYLKDYDSANTITNITNGFHLSVKNNEKKGIGYGYFLYGKFYDQFEYYDTAIAHYNRALPYFKVANDLTNISNCYNNLGNINLRISNYPLGLDYHLKALKIREALKDEKLIAASYLNIGLFYRNQKIYDKALEYLRKAESIYILKQDDQSLSSCYLNMANVYSDNENDVLAKKYYEKGLEVALKIGNQQALNNIYYGLSIIYRNEKNYPKLFEYINKSIAISNQLGIHELEANSYLILGDVYEKDKKQYQLALDYYKKALPICKELQQKEIELNILLSIAKCEYYLNHFKSSADNYFDYIQKQDTIFNEKNSKELSDIKTKFEVEKKEVLFKAEQTKKEQEILFQKRLRNVSIVALILLIGVLFYIFKNLQQIRKKNVIISHQKKLVDEKQKEIVDSITYAKRLQQGILPSKAYFQSVVPNHFIFYQPKDIVAGDFYWLEKIGDLLFIAAADSTGHGVPGAMVSVVCNNALNRAVKEFQLKDTGQILDKTKQLIVETFERSENIVNDGMDISLLCIDHNNQKITWSGANNALWYSANNEWETIEANKQSISKTDKTELYTTHEIAYNPNTIFYLLTDGFADQFGGPKEKKFLSKKLKDHLSQIAHLACEEQEKNISKIFSDWKGTLEQVDDVTIIGVKIQDSRFKIQNIAPNLEF
jgi:serine phosphatase RsbU (regulator of sigma subunit)